MSWSSIRGVSFGLAALSLVATGCASGARDVSGITPVPEEPIDGYSPEDSGFDAGNDETDSGFDAGDLDSGSGAMDSGFDSGFDAGAPFDAGMPITCTNDQPNSCGSAGSSTHVVNQGDTVVVSGVVDASGDDYMVFSFADVINPAMTYHPRFELVTNPMNLYSLTIESACGTPATACSSNVSIFDMNYAGNSGTCDIAGKCSDNVPRITSFIVRVHRSGVATNCFTYSVQATNNP